MSRGCVSCCTSADEDQTGNSSLRSSVAVDVMYVDPTTGNTVSGDSAGDATAAARANCLKHRSLFIDPETVSLPLQLPGPVAGLSADRMVGLPVASVTLRRVCLSDRLAGRLADILLRHRSFRMLSFVKCHRVDACLFRIRQTLVHRKCKVQSKLSRLHIRLSHVDDVKIVADLAEVLSHSLHSLSLTGCSIMSTGCAAVVRSLVAGSRCLLELDLGFNDVADVGPLSGALAKNCSLRRLRLRGNAIGPAAAVTLFCSLRRNYRLELLDISGNPIGERQKSSGDDLCDVLAETLLSNRTLRELKLERCSLGLDACSALGRALAANTTMRVLDVSMNQSIGDLGVALLADGLRRNRRCAIYTLALNMCAVGNAGFRSLLIAIKDGGAAGLRQVKLCYNCIGSKDQAQLAWWRSGPGATDGERGGVLRPRPASAHLELLPVSDQPGGSTLASGWRIATAREGSEAAPSSTPVRRKIMPVADRWPMSSIVTSRSLLVETTNQNKQSMTPQNFVSSASNARRVSSGAAFNDAIHRPALESTPKTTQQLKTYVDSDCTSDVVQQRLTSSDLSDLGRSSRTDLIHSTSSELGTTERGSSTDSAGMTPTWPDRSQRSSCTAEEDGDVDYGNEHIYALLCKVLRANPELKVLLWGNEQWYSAGVAASTATELDDVDVTEPVVKRSVDEMTSNGLDRIRAAYGTLPRSYEFAPHLF